MSTNVAGPEPAWKYERRSMHEARKAGDWWVVLGKGWESACPAVGTREEALWAARSNHPHRIGELVDLAICVEPGTIGCEFYELQEKGVTL